MQVNLYSIAYRFILTCDEIRKHQPIMTHDVPQTLHYDSQIVTANFGMSFLAVQFVHFELLLFEIIDF